MINKKAQEEIVGFIAIVIIISIAVFILITISIRTNQPDIQIDTVEARQFVDSLIHVKTDCETGSARKTIIRLTDLCNTDPDQHCDNGNTFCEELNETIKEIFEESWNVGPDKKNQNCQLEIFKNESGTIERIIDPIFCIPSGTVQTRGYSTEVSIGDIYYRFMLT